MAKQISDLLHALGESETLARRFADKQPAVFLDYDGTLTPIRDRPGRTSFPWELPVG